MNLNGSAANLSESLKELRLEWEQTRNYWRDTKSQEFEDQYLDRLPNDVARAAAVIKEIAALMKKIHDDCD
jgi:hypothetical protein